jgi:hypothetical protein
MCNVKCMSNDACTTTIKHFFTDPSLPSKYFSISKKNYVVNIENLIYIVTLYHIGYVYLLFIFIKYILAWSYQ